MDPTDHDSKKRFFYMNEIELEFSHEMLTNEYDDNFNLNMAHCHGKILELLHFGVLLKFHR